mgnify:CR=1 FL=1
MLATLPPEEKLDPRVKRTRGLIQQAFTELLPEKGFRAITVQDIADRAEVNRATFYAHFPDKYALLDTAIREAFRQELEKRTLNACHYSVNNLHALIVTVCEFVVQLHERCRAFERQFESLAETQVKKQIQELIELWLAQVGSEDDPKITATAASWAIYGLALQWSQDKNRPSAQAYAERVAPLAALNLRVAHPI